MLKVKKLIEDTSYKFQHIHQCKLCLQKITSQKSERVPNTCIKWEFENSFYTNYSKRGLKN